MKLVARNSWANLFKSQYLAFSEASNCKCWYDSFYVQTIDSKDQDELHSNSFEMCMKLFNRQITLEEFYKNET
jgi:hypothetical protein